MNHANLPGTHRACFWNLSILNSTSANTCKFESFMCKKMQILNKFVSTIAYATGKCFLKDKYPLKAFVVFCIKFLKGCDIAMPDASYVNVITLKFRRLASRFRVIMISHWQFDFHIICLDSPRY